MTTITTETTADTITYSAEPVLTIEVPGRAVSANARLGYNRRTGAKYLTAAAREWRDTVAWETKVAYVDVLMMRDNYAELVPPLRIVVNVYGTKLDGDNALKLILDGLKDGIGIDDRHYKSVEVHTTGKGMKEPRTVITVYEAAQ